MSYKRKHQEDVVATNSPPKQKRQFTDRDRQRASVYEQLADDKQGTRIQAAKKLVDEFAPSNSPDVEKLKDVFSRLIKGLCSGRKSARAGYFIAFSELLRQTVTSGDLFEEATGGLEELVRLINRLTKPDRNSPQENRDKHIGRVAAYKAFLQSSILKDAKSASDENWDFFLSQTAKQAQSNPWLREECGSMLCDYVVGSAQTQPSQEHFVMKMIDKYQSEGLLETAEGVALWLTTQKAYPELKLPKDVWHKREPLHTTERNRLARILCDSRGSANTETGKGQKSKVKTSGSWKPQPNFAWRVVLQHAFVKYSSPAKLRQFCIEVLDNSLFAEKASSERKLWGFNLLAWAIRNAPVDLLSAVFTPNFMRSLINHRADSERELFHAAESPLDAIASRGEKDAVAASKLLEILISSDLSVQVDAITKSSTLSRLTGNVPEEGKESMVNAIGVFIIQPPSQEIISPEAAHHARVVFANLYVSMIARHAKHENSVDDALTKKITETISAFAYLHTKDAIPPIFEDSRSMFHDAVIRCINHTLPKLSDAGTWLASLVHHIHKSSSTSGQSLAMKADKSTLESISEAHATLKKLRNSTDPARKDMNEPFKVLQVLFSLTILEAYSGDADAVDMLSELQTCHTSLEEQDTTTEAFDLLVELLLSFLSKTSSLYRQIGEFIFPTLAEGMSGDGLDSLLDILVTKETVAGQGELFDPANAEEDDVDDDEISIDSDVEILSASDDESDDGTQNGSDDDNESDEEDDAELQQFNNMLAQTLKTAKPKEDASTEDSSDDESDMDDDQMMALDPQLTKIFQERRKAAGLGDSGSAKKEKSKAKLQMTLFKSRVLDLLQIYVKKQHDRPIVCKVMMPLLALMRTTMNAELEKKAKTTLGSWFEVCDRNKEYPIAEDIDEAWNLLREVHDEVQQPGSKQHTMICGRASLFIAKVIMLRDRSHIKRLVEEYGKTQVQVIESGANVQPAFFTEWCGWCMQWKKNASKQESGTEPVVENGDTSQTIDGATEHADLEQSNKISGRPAKEQQGRRSKKQGKKQRANGLKA